MADPPTVVLKVLQVVTMQEVVTVEDRGGEDGDEQGRRRYRYGVSGSHVMVYSSRVTSDFLLCSRAVDVFAGLYSALDVSRKIVAFLALMVALMGN